MVQFGFSLRDLGFGVLLGALSLGAIPLVSPVSPDALAVNLSTTSTTEMPSSKGKPREKDVNMAVVDIAEMTPVLHPDTPAFHLKATVTLPAGTDFQADVSLSVASRTPITRQELADWAVDKTRKTTLKTVATMENVSLFAARPRELEFKVPRQDLPLGHSSEWGPRFLEVSVTPHLKRKPAQEPFSARSFLVWDSGAAFKPSQMLALMPVVTTPADAAQSGQVLPDFAAHPAPRQVKLCELAQIAPLTPVFDPLLMNPHGKTLATVRRALQLKETTPKKTNSKPGTTEKTDNHVNTLNQETQGLSTNQNPPYHPTLAELQRAGQCGNMPPAYLPPGDFAAANTAWLNHHQPGTNNSPHQTNPEVTSNRKLLTAAQHLAARLNDTPGVAHWQENLILWPQLSGSPTPNIATEVTTWGTKAPLVVESDAQYTETPKPETYQTDARHEIEVNHNTTTLGWVADRELSDLLNNDATHLGFETNNTPSPLLLRQWALATTAVLTRERPFAPRLFVAGTSRDYAATPAQTTVIKALIEARWLEFPNWREVSPDNRGHLKLTPPPPPKKNEFTTLTSSDNTGRTIYANPAWNLAQNLERSAALETVMENSAEFREAFQEIQVRSMCASCENTLPNTTLSPGNHTAKPREDNHPDSATNPGWHLMNPPHPGATALIDPDVSEKLLNLVKAQPASVINLIDKEAKIPISVTNNYDTPVDVRVRLKASNSRLQFDQSPQLRIPAHATAQTRIPVTAVGHGDITVRVTLGNEAGQEIGRPEEIQLRVHAQWESTGVYVLAVILTIVLIGGITRRIVKGRKPKREKS
ncbi:DUF6049 family protein [Mobiluncus mulieris]|uniref:DUF6049 family protein n=1 Tax=Mobiluncus mulieris TaxID=2052 RepID=UPI00242EEABF|nr:DUF6049 family protein [Mobiluncus mulieris]